MPRPTAGELEQRAAPEIELEGRRLRGLIPYGVESRDMGGWREVMEPGCLTAAQLDDLVATVDHAGVPLGRHPDTLEVEDRDDGLHWSVDLAESRADVREAVERRDLRASSWRMRVARDEWRGDVRHVLEVAELRDVAVVTAAAYPSAGAELRHAPEQEPPVPPITPPEPPPARGTLTLEDRNGDPPVRGLADEFRSRGWPGERAEVPFERVFEDRALTWTGSVDNLNPTRRQGVGLAFDRRYVWPVLPRIGVDSATTSVQIMRQSARTLPAPDDVIRPLAETTPKPEVSSVLEVISEGLSQVAAVQSGVPNIYLEQPAVNPIIEGDLRLAINEALDQLVLDALETAPSAPTVAGTSLIVAVRGAITTLAALGYAPDTLVVDPATDEALDVLVTADGTEDYVFGPGQPAGQIWGLNRRVAKAATVPIVLDSTAFGRLYASPVSLARFEENAGKTNTSLIRLEGTAAVGVERVDAALQLTPAAGTQSAKKSD